MGRLSSSQGSINEGGVVVTSAAPVLVSSTLPSAVPANDSSEMESVSMESADRTFGRGAQMGRGEWRPPPVRERGAASLETRTGSDGSVTD